MGITSIIYSAVAWLVYVYGLYTIIFTIIASIAAVNQERKIWLGSSQVPPIPLLGLVKVFYFNVVWMLLCNAGSVIIIIKKICTLGQSSLEWDAHNGVEHFVAKLCIRIVIGNFKIIGEENLPPDNNLTRPAPVFVFNHASQIDVGVVYNLNRRFKWIAKSSVFFIPGVGLTMYLSRHVFINRNKGKNKQSRSNLFDKSNDAVQSGIPMFFFPQGTRRMTERLPFKDGAFIVALENKSPLIPVSIEIPMNAWTTGLPFFSSEVPEVVLTVHKPITLTGNENKEELKQRCFDQIYSVLPDTWSESEKKEKEKKKDK